MGAKSFSRPAVNLYDQDFALWTAETARLLREGRFHEVDIEQVAEEIEDMGKSQNRELLSRLTLIIQHLLKWQCQPEKRSRSWQSTISVQRTELGRLFEQSPSLRQNLPRLLTQVYSDAVEQASIETGLAPDSFPTTCPFTPEQILDRGFLPGR